MVVHKIESAVRSVSEEYNISSRDKAAYAKAKENSNTLKQYHETMFNHHAGEAVRYLKSARHPDTAPDDRKTQMAISKKHRSAAQKHDKMYRAHSVQSAVQTDSEMFNITPGDESAYMQAKKLAKTIPEYHVMMANHHSQRQKRYSKGSNDTKPSAQHDVEKGLYEQHRAASRQHEKMARLAVMSNSLTYEFEHEPFNEHIVEAADDTTMKVSKYSVPKVQRDHTNFSKVLGKHFTGKPFDWHKVITRASFAHKYSHKAKNTPIISIKRRHTALEPNYVVRVRFPHPSDATKNHVYNRAIRTKHPSTTLHKMLTEGRVAYEHGKQVRKSAP